MSSAGVPSPGNWTKVCYLIRRRATTSREELVAHWFGGHMPAVIADQHRRAEAGRPYPRRYLVTLYDPVGEGEYPWDGMAQLWWEAAPPLPDEPHGETPADTFQQKAEPYMPWNCVEYVAIEGADRLPAEPLTLNTPFPSTRSGFYKASYLVTAQPGTDFGAFYDHWLTVHCPNVIEVMNRTGGFRYAISHSTAPGRERYAGMAELYFPDREAWREFGAAIEPDGMERWVDGRSTLVLGSVTEMIGIP